MKKIDLDYFKNNIASEKILDLGQANKKVIDGILLDDLDISTQKISSKKFTNCEWSNVSAIATEFTNVEFNNCKFKESTFQNSKFVNVTFNNCTLFATRFYNSDFIKVKFNKSKIVDNKLDFFKGFSSLKQASVEFIDSELVNLTFNKSSGHFIFINSKFLDTNSSKLLAPSSIRFENSTIENSDFSNSTLTSFTLKNTEIKDSKMNDATVDEITIDDSTIAFAIAGTKINTFIARNIKGKKLALGRSTINKLTISGCDKMEKISLSKTQFNELTISDCKNTYLKASNSKGNKISIRNSEFDIAKFKGFFSKELIFSNMIIKKQADFENAIVDESQITNFSIKSGSKVNMNGTNINFQ